MKVKKQTFKGYAVMSIGNNKHIDFYSALPQHFTSANEIIIFEARMILDRELQKMRDVATADDNHTKRIRND